MIAMWKEKEKGKTERVRLNEKLRPGQKKKKEKKMYEKRKNEKEEEKQTNKHKCQIFAKS